MVNQETNPTFKEIFNSLESWDLIELFLIGDSISKKYKADKYINIWNEYVSIGHSDMLDIRLNVSQLIYYTQNTNNLKSKNKIKMANQKQIYVIQVQFKNHNNEQVREFKEQEIEMYSTRFLGYSKTDLVEFSEAKVYESYKAAEKITKTLDTKAMCDYGNILETDQELKVTIRTFTISL